MRRFVVSLPDDLFLAIQRSAKQRGKSMAAVLREAAEKDVWPPQPWPKSIGTFDSGYTDTSELASQGQVPPRSRLLWSTPSLIGEPKLVTLDQCHFRMMRPRHVHALTLLPD